MSELLLQDELVRRLREAIETGEIVRVRYDGGSQPGATRDILPIRIAGSFVQARDNASTHPKDFRLDKLALVGLEEPVSYAEVTERLESLDGVLSIYRKALEETGWIVEIEKVGAEETISCYRTTKAGKRRKHPGLQLTFEPEAFDYVGTLTGEIEKISKGPRSRPWGVREDGKSLGTWGSINAALPKFLSAAGISQRGAIDPK